MPPDGNQGVDNESKVSGDSSGLMSRRKFLGLAAASLGGAALAGCSPQPASETASYPMQYPSTSTGSSNVEKNERRRTLIEQGYISLNIDPNALGAVDAFNNSYPSAIPEGMPIKDQYTISYGGEPFKDVTFLHMKDVNGWKLGDTVPVIYPVPKEERKEVSINAFLYGNSADKNLELDINSDYFVIPVVTSDLKSPSTIFQQENNVLPEGFPINPAESLQANRGYLTFALLKRDSVNANNLQVLGVVRNDASGFEVKADNFPPEYSDMTK